MRAGIFNHYCALQTKAITRNAYGEEVETWALFSGAWAKLPVQSGKEDTQSDTQAQTVSIELHIRHIEGLSRTMRIIFAGETYQIQSILPDYKNRFTKLVCTRVDA